MRNTIICAFSLVLLSGSVVHGADIAPGSQPWGGMVREEIESPKARSEEARRILEAARRLEARSAGMDFEETPDERALFEYLKDLAKRSEIRMDSGKGKAEAVKESLKREIRGESLARAVESERKDAEEAVPVMERELPAVSGNPGDVPSVKTVPASEGFDMDNGRESVIRAGRKIDTAGEPMPEVDIIEEGGVPDSQWVSREQKEINDIVHSRRAKTPFSMKKGDQAEVFIYPCNADSMQFWHDLRINEDARSLIDQGRIRVLVPHRDFSDSGPAIVWAWFNDKDPELARDFLDYVADLPKGHLEAERDMAEKIDAWLKKRGRSFDEISRAGRDERKKAALEVQASMERYRKLKGDFSKFPSVFVNGKANPNYFLKIETER